MLWLRIFARKSQLLMFMRRLLLCTLALVSITPLLAQKKQLTIQDAAGNWSLYPRGLSSLQWIPNTNLYGYMAKGDSMVLFNAEDQDFVRAITLKQLNEWVNDETPLERFPRLKWHDKGQRISFATDESITSIALADGKARVELKLPKGYDNLEYHEHKGNWVSSYHHDGVLHVSNHALHQADDHREYGKSVHRSEFGISKGIFWSSNCEKVAFYRNDQSAVRDYPMTAINQENATHEPIKYPMAGEPNEVVKLGVYHVQSMETVFLKTGDADQYLTNITWGPESKFVYVGVLNRGQDHLKWQQYDARTGQLVKTLFEEQSESFVEPLHPLYFVPGSTDEFVWLTWKDGFTAPHLYSVSEGHKQNLLPDVNWEVKGFEGFSEDGTSIFFTGTGNNPLETHLFSLPIENPKKPEQITSKMGTHNVSLSDNGQFVLDVYSNRKTPSETLLLNAKGRKLKKLHTADNPMAEYVNNTIDFFTIPSADEETTLHCRLIKPHDFDKKKKYPAIVYVYGGPHAQMVTERWMGGASFFLHYMAQQGYLVFTVDNRGSDNRGRDFEQCTHRQLGKLEMEDQLEGVKWLKEQDYVDTERIGVHGWSYGGFMTTSLMLNYPETFKAGVCGGPVIDWGFYEIMYTERYMDTPEENPEGYADASLLNEVDNLQGKLLIVHGTNDDVVVWQHTLAFIEACTQKGVLFDYFPYPGGKHHWGGPARTHLMMKMAQYFEEQL